MRALIQRVSSAAVIVDDETVGEIVTILRDNADVLAESFGGFRGMDPDDMIVDIGVPYHPGAVAALGDN